jgi:hypothetical protein
MLTITIPWSFIFPPEFLSLGSGFYRGRWACQVGGVIDKKERAFLARQNHGAVIDPLQVMEFAL